MKLISVNVGRAVPLMAGGRMHASAIRKLPVAGCVAVRPLGLEGDEQADPSVHGGLSKAVYAYPSEHHGVWRTLRAQAGLAGWSDPVPPGLFGENLLLTGLLEPQAWVGDVLVFDGGVELVVSEPRMPCFKFDAVMGFRQASRMMVQSGTCGFYLAVRMPGVIQAGAGFHVRAGAREVSIAELFRARAGRHRG